MPTLFQDDQNPEINRFEQELDSRAVLKAYQYAGTGPAYHGAVFLANGGAILVPQELDPDTMISKARLLLVDHYLALVYPVPLAEIGRPRGKLDKSSWPKPTRRPGRLAPRLTRR